ncbi:MAG: rhodanese-like domain-containing protein [Candidatus Berkiella sp.]
MDPYISFFVEHWMLSAAFAVILLLLIGNELRHRSFGVPGISSQQLVDLLNHKDAVIIDIRSHERFDLGHILGAINIPAENFDAGLKTLNKYKNRPMVLVCSQGNDAPKKGKVLKGNGYTDLYHLAGGMDAWHAQGMPVTKR